MASRFQASPLALLRPGFGNNGNKSTVIAFFGDSITNGSCPVQPFVASYTQNAGYRKYVYQYMLAEGLNPLCLGSLQDSVVNGVSALLAGDYQSGYSGTFWATWMPGAGANYLLGNVKPAMDARTGAPTIPKIIVIMLGANAGNDSGNATGQMNLLDLILSTWPTAWVVQCSRTPQIAANSDVVNAAVAAGVATRVAAGARCSFFNVFPLITTSTGDLPDGLHPSEAGYAKIGQAIAQYIVTGISKGTFT
jgi:lysophospholipase L1-like esterase